MSHVLCDAALLPVLESTLEIEWRPHTGPWAVEVGSPAETTSLVLERGQRLTLGTSRISAHRVRDRAVSALHCALTAGDRGVELEDLGSKNGVFVGAGRIQRAWLQSECSTFVIGRTTVCVRPASSDAPCPGGASIPGLVGGSSAMRRVAEDVRRHAQLRAPVLIQGESGTGKDVVARALHSLGRRKGAYVPLNVGAIPESLADSELFGHVRGAFTGAVSPRAGAFEQAHRGTLLLDEIADLAPALQVKLLRVVEDRCVRPVGGTHPIECDVRVISASWASLSDRVALGRFRVDLYHRLSTVEIRLPPLRERRSDLPALSHALLRRLADELGERTLSSAALARLVAYAWPGNVRELSSVLYRAAVACHGAQIEAHHIDVALPADAREPMTLERGAAEALLREHRGNFSAAARAARVPRTTFREWIVRGEPKTKSRKSTKRRGARR